MSTNGIAAGPPAPSARHSHDKFFKSVFKVFLKDLVEMVHPQIAALLDLDRVTFNTETLFSHHGQGDHASPDLVGSAPLKEDPGEGVVLVHLEIEAEHRASMEKRMWRYFSLLNSHHDTEVFAIVIFLSGGPSGVQRRRYRMKIGEVEIIRYTYWAFGLSAADAEEWLAKPQALARALAAMMKVRGDKVEHKLRCLRAIAAAEHDPRRFYLLNLMIDLYLKLREDEQLRYDAALAEEKAMLPTIPDIPLSLEEYEEAMDKSENRGLAKGKNLGVVEGIADSIVRLVGRRFGFVPATLKAQLEAIGDPRRLQEIFDAALDATSLSQLEATIAGG